MKYYIILFILIISILFCSMPTMVFASESTEVTTGGGSSHESESDREHGGGSESFDVSRTEAVFLTYELVLGWILGVWQTFEVFEGVTIWNIIVSVLLSFGIIMLIKSQFGDNVSEATKLTNNRIARNRTENFTKNGDK